MTATGKMYPSLIDAMKTEDTDGADVLELMAQTNPMLKDAFYQPCNKENNTHVIKVRTGIPTAIFREYYQGTPSSKSEYTTVEVSTAELSSRGEVDQKLVDNHPNPKGFRLLESQGHLEAVNNTIQEEVIYGSKKAGGKFDGFANLYNTISTDKKKIGYYVIDAGGTSNDQLTSIYLVSWGDKKCGFIHPQNSKSGLVHEDKGVQTTTDEKGNRYEIYEDKYTWDIGLAVEDWRSCGRIANIPVNRIGEIDLFGLLDKLIRRCRKFSGKMTKDGFELERSGDLTFATNTVLYAPDEILSALDAQAKAKPNIQYSVKEYLETEVETYKQVPIRVNDAISLDEKIVA